jgi:hypothetical protein
VGASAASPVLAPIPALRFRVHGAMPVVPAAVPMLSFSLGIEAPESQPVRSIVLDVQLQIAARARGYAEEEQGRLLELFGAPERWATTLRSVPWIRTTVIVPPFTAETAVDLQVPCSYDLEVSANRYFAALDDGEIPLELLFSGSVFFAGPGGLLQTSRIALDQEVAYRLPVATWRAVMDHHFPNSAWVRLDRETFNRLCAFKARHTYRDWEAALNALLEEHS